MKAIIPVAGLGSRLRPHTYTLPKVLLNVAGKPILGHILDKILLEGITSATIIVGYMGEMVEDYVKQNYSFDVKFIEQKEPQGLGHAIMLAKEDLGNEPVLIILGDTIFDVDLRPILSGYTSMIGVKRVEDPRRFGVVELNGLTISRLIEKPDKPTTNLAIVGLYFITHPNILASCLDELVQNNERTRGEYQLTDALQKMIDRGEQFSTFNIEGWLDCGKPETLLETNRHLLDKKNLQKELPGVVINPPVYISPTAQIRNSVIGPYTTISDGASVLDSIVTDSIVGYGSVVEQSILTESIVGNNAVVRGNWRRVNIGANSELYLG